jgi:hypothetical protein
MSKHYGNMLTSKSQRKQAKRFGYLRFIPHNAGSKLQADMKVPIVHRSAYILKPISVETILKADNNRLVLLGKFYVEQAPALEHSLNKRRKQMM